MPIYRYYMPDPLEPHTIVELKDEEFHHLHTVVRLRENDEVELVNGQGTLAQAVICEIKKRSALIEIKDSMTAKAMDHQLVLYQAFPKLNRLEFIIEKGTELGMTSLVLFPGERSEKKSVSENQLERFKAIAISAMKQSGRLFLPEITLKEPISKWKKPEIPSFYGDVSPDAPPFRKTWTDVGSPNHMGFFIGPESGFSESEERTLIQWNAHGVKLHSNILRTDTASLTALTLMSDYIFG